MDRAMAEAILDKVLELKVRFWEMALGELGDVVDDYGTQTSQIVSPGLFREVFKPRLRELIGAIHRASPGIHLMFHSCGSVREVKEHVRRNIEALAPGGGFVFTAVHNVQADVPPENFMAMWEALQEFG